MKNWIYIIVMIWGLAPILSIAQTNMELKEKLIDGVEQFRGSELEKATMSFASGSSLEGYEDIATYNRGRSLLEAKQFEDASNVFSEVIEMSENSDIIANSWYNKGNISLMNSDPSSAIDAYKSALRNNPNFPEARHNLANAYKMKQQQEQKQDQQQDQQDDGDQGEDSENGENEDNGEQEDDSKQEDDGEQEDDGKQEDDSEQDGESEQKDDQDGDSEQNKQEAQPQEKQLSMEEMERILENLENLEGKIQEKVMRARSKGKKKQIEKDW